MAPESSGGPPTETEMRARLPDEPTPETVKVVAYNRGSDPDDAETYMLVRTDADEITHECCWLLDAPSMVVYGPIPVLQATKFNPYELYDTLPEEPLELLAAADLQRDYDPAPE